MAGGFSLVKSVVFLLNFTLSDLEQKGNPSLLDSGSESSFIPQWQSKVNPKVLATWTYEQLWFQISLWVTTEPVLKFSLTLYPALSLPQTLITSAQGASQKSILDFEQHHRKGCFPEKLTYDSLVCKTETAMIA